MPVINITVKNKIATQDKTVYVCGNSDYVANFDFDSEWDKYEIKTARFAYNGKIIDIVFEGTQCPVPIISNAYFFYLGVFAGDLHTTTPARVPCTKSILCGSGWPSPPPPDVYNQLMELLNSMGAGLTDEDALQALMETGVVSPVADSTGALLTDEAGKILSE